MFRQDRDTLQLHFHEDLHNWQGTLWPSGAGRMTACVRLQTHLLHRYLINVLHRLSPNCAPGALPFKVTAAYRGTAVHVSLHITVSSCPRLTAGTQRT